ncbi:uncharacterized protein RHOBADRAFT_53275 [Rhodotorula graminis WP1]|uniref:Uncharacterized protein n=1 Tax=Rhodotorula graminis (strain WP1) TaxID=578459 RepID=A0A194S431_RHOGW|nr:uncharacterized protein RHOBADRAFT_53275 [Rhodotorula graminis WP1]KPV75279.1 hypothetical protein RHOBADRAFT_53275 [Rhodotorula graminis WP1]
MLGTTLLQTATKALRTPVARPCLCRSPLASTSSSSSPSSSSTLARLLSSSAPARHHLLSTSSPAPSRSPFTALHRALSPVSAPTTTVPSAGAAAPTTTSPLGQTRTFKMPRCVKRKTSPVARNGGAGKAARKHSARAAKRRRQRSKKIN